MSERWYCATCSPRKTPEQPVPCRECCGWRAPRPGLVRVARAKRKRGKW